MDDRKNEVNRESKELFKYKELPIVSLPQCVIDRVKVVSKLSQDGLSVAGEFLFVLGDKGICDQKTAKDIDRFMPKPTQEFIDWRDNYFLRRAHQMKIMVALIYRYKLEDSNDK